RPCASPARSISTRWRSPRNDGVTGYVAGRVLALGVLLFGLLCITFAISHVIPGDPARLAAGPDASEAMVQTLRAQYGLDRWLGLMLQLVIALHLGWLPLGGRLNLTTELPPPITHLLLVDAVLRGQWATLGDGLRHAVLPVVTSSFPALASILRVNRAEMLETLHQDYILNARAQGLGGLRVVAKLALRNAMIPPLTMIGLRYGWMLGGTLLV